MFFRKEKPNILSSGGIIVKYDFFYNAYKKHYSSIKVIKLHETEYNVLLVTFFFVSCVHQFKT